jgi:hypothetical protein
VTGITPDNGINSGKVSITNLSGANFLSGATVKLSKSGQPDIVATDVVVVSTSKITCVFDLTGVEVGYWDLTVSNLDGRFGSLPSAFRVNYSPPTVKEITPDGGQNTGWVSITNLSGTNFRSGISVKLTKIGESDILAENVVVESAQKITCRFDLTGKSTGFWDVVVTNTDNQSATLSRGFKIEAPVLMVTKPVAADKNPYNPSAGAMSIKYSLSQDAPITVYIYNMRGERIWEWKSPAGEGGGKVGENEVLWTGVTAFQSYASTGVYFVYVTTIENGVPKTLSKMKIAIIK